MSGKLVIDDKTDWDKFLGKLLPEERGAVLRAVTGFNKREHFFDLDLVGLRTQRNKFRFYVSLPDRRGGARILLKLDGGILLVEKVDYRKNVYSKR